jgi:hypothetical protein
MVSSAFRVIGAVALFSFAISLSPGAMAAGINHAPKAAMQKANGEMAVKKKKCSSAFDSQPASVKAKGKKAFMNHCINVK